MVNLIHTVLIHTAHQRYRTSMYIITSFYTLYINSIHNHVQNHCVLHLIHHQYGPVCTLSLYPTPPTSPVSTIMHIITASYTSYITSMYLYVRNHCILHLPHIRCSESHTYHWQASYRHLGPEKSALLPSKQTFDKACRLFKTLQPRFDNFLCPICCPDGDISLCPSWHIDGVAIGLQRNKAEFKPVDVGHVTDTDPVIGT